MKKFAKIIFCCMLCLVSIFFVACDKRSEKEKNFNYPSNSSSVQGNGGMAVRVGDYLYFANGYRNVDDTYQNESQVVGALMLMKLNDGAIIRNNDGLVADENYITMFDKLTGFQATDIFVGGDYLYFTTISQDNEGGKKDAEWAKERVEIYKVKLDKSSGVERIYQSQVKYDSVQTKFYYVDGNTYCLVYEKGTSKDDSSVSNALYRVNGNENSSKRVDSGLSSIVMAEDYDKTFYTKDNSTDGEYYLKRYNVVSDRVSDYETKNVAIEVKAVENGKVFVTYEQHSYTSLFYSTIENSSAFTLACYNVKDYTIVVSKDATGVALIKDKNFTFYQLGTTTPIGTVTDSNAESINYIGQIDGKILYYSGNDIKTISFSDYLLTSQTEIKTLATVEDLSVDYFDIDDEYVYFYKTVGNHEYLHRLQVLNNVDKSVEMVGIYLSEDVPVISEE